jgi:ABC-type lipoprotein release transport system permease subunit
MGPDVKTHLLPALRRVVLTASVRSFCRPGSLLSPLDPASLVLATGTLLLTSLAACCIPAWRAARLDPLTALREE